MNAATSVTAELVLLRWMLDSSVALSNVDLAAISNINRNWRAATKRAILEEASGPTSQLLLPSMVHSILHTTASPICSHVGDSKSAQQSSTGSSRIGGGREDAFCAAWFATEGIQEIEIRVTDESTNSNNLSPQSKAPPKQQPAFSFMTAQGKIVLPGTGQPAENEKEEDVLSPVCAEWKGYSTAVQVLQPFNYHATFVDDVIFAAFALTHRTESSWTAVRGATCARPESYCCCVDVQQSQLDLELSRAAAKDWGPLLQQARRIASTQRDVCPRIIRRQAGTKAVQFLNASQSHAVCMMTPRFEPPIHAPMTIFCVGVATEDGCFLSGLFRRLELGHLYPQTAVHAATELSSVCVAADGVSPLVLDHTNEENDSDDSSDGMDADSDASERLVRQCTCPFRGVCDKGAIADDHSDDSSKEPCFVSRGTTGPGAWHCYTAVVDGSNTVIRVDGIHESSSASTSSVKTPSESNIFLDGLTLGSDHGFGMSLCCGGMSDGTGHGAIAEVAVFAGRLADSDLMQLEQHLMRKHAIPVQNELDRDHWDREAHALLVVDDEAATGFGAKVPLRYLARHRNVAWTQSDPVTGHPLVIKRIGSRYGAESSDF